MKEIPLMTESEWSDFAGTPFNPPSSDLTDDEFEKEFYATEKALRAILNELGVKDDVLDNGFGRTRGIGFQLSEGSPLETPLLVPMIQRWLATLPEVYDIAIMSDNYDFYLYVTKDRITAFTKDFTRLQRYGLKPQSNQPVQPTPLRGAADR